MPEYIGGTTSKLDKIGYISLIIFFLIFLVSVPFMIADKQARLDHDWKTKGCQMYDNELLKDVPAKCQTYFVDHYQSREPRLQPPDIQ